MLYIAHICQTGFFYLGISTRIIIQGLPTKNKYANQVVPIPTATYDEKGSVVFKKGSVLWRKR